MKLDANGGNCYRYPDLFIMRRQNNLIRPSVISDLITYKF
jgi:hypothetical protein